MPPELGLKAAARQVRLLYTSTDGVRGKGIIAVSGALFLPRGTPPVGGWPLVAWAHGTVGVADICAPSWAGRSLRDLTYLDAWLDAGFAVVATDYQGLGTPGPHPYLYTRPAAYDLLDSVRAVTKSGFGLSSKTILVGQSQGGIAVVATGGYAHDYAPDVDIRGIVATGAGSDRVRPGELPKLDLEMVSPLLGYLPLAVLTAQQSDPTLRDEDVVTDRALGLMEQGRRACFPALAADATGAGLTFANALKPNTAARIGAINNPNMGYPTYRLTAPLFVGSGSEDQDVRPPMQAALVREACAAGTIVEAHIYRGRDHSGALNASLKDSLPFARKARSGGASAFLTVQEGCDKFCTFCVVPYTRGAELSRPADALLAEARALVAGGAKELTLLGQNVNAYRDGDTTLSGLIRRIAAIPGLARLRYTTSHPRDMGDDLIAAHAEVPALMPYLHLPVQSGSSRILRAMNRAHTRESYLATLDRLRVARSDIALSGDFIVGFPGETDADFAATLSIVREVGYAQAYSFKYSLRPGTPAAGMAGQVPEAVKDARLAELQAAIAASALAFNRASVGARCDVLLDRPGRRPGQLIGKSPWLQSVFVVSPAAKIGDMVTVDLIDAQPNSLEGAPVFLTAAA